MAKLAILCHSKKKFSFSSVSPSCILNILRAVKAIVATRKKTRGTARTADGMDAED